MSMLQPTTFSSSKICGDAIATDLVEVFSAIQGEGVNVGTRQLFIRFGGCDLRCSYCDSAHTWQPSVDCEIEIEPGQRNYETIENPVSLEQLLVWVKRLDQPQVHDSISLTGGEPLLHADFLQAFLPRLKQQSHLPIYLETGGHRDRDLESVLPYIDLIGMDLKLPSVSGEEHWEAHHRFLQTAYGNAEIFCKLIVSNQTSTQDLKQAAEVMGTVDKAIACFLQPMTPVGRLTPEERLERGLAIAPSPEQVLGWQILMKRVLKNVRVIPQTHKMMNQK